MKKQLLCLFALLLCVGSVKAQLKPEKGSFGLGFNLTGLLNVSFSNFGSSGLEASAINDPLGYLPAGITVGELVPQQMLFGRYYASEDFAVRLSLGINSTSEGSISMDSVAGSTGRILETNETQFSVFSFALGIGAEKHFASKANRIDPYAGAQIQLSLLGKPGYEAKNEIFDDPAYVQETRVEWAGGSGFGLDLIAGFNYFFTDNFSIGAEMSWGFGSASIGGEYVENVSTTFGGSTNVTERRGSLKQTQAGFRVGSTAGILASIFW